MDVQEKKVKEEEIDRKASVETEGGREKDPVFAAEVLTAQPVARRAPGGIGDGDILRCERGVQSDTFAHETFQAFDGGSERAVLEFENFCGEQALDSGHLPAD